MNRLLTVSANLADSLHYMLGVRFDVVGVDNNRDYQKAVELDKKAHAQLLEIINGYDGWVSIDKELPPYPNEYLVYYGNQEVRQRQTVYLDKYQFSNKVYLQAVGITHWAYLMSPPIDDFADDDMPFLKKIRKIS